MSTGDAHGASSVPGNPGPLARFLTVTADPSTPEIIVQRLAGGETLRDITKAWEIPHKRFLAWIAANAALTEQCKRVLEIAGIEMRMEGLEIVDGASAESIAVDKQRALYRERLSRDLNRPLFGKFTQHKHEHSFDLGERLRRARERQPQTLESVEDAEIVKPTHELI